MTATRLSGLRPGSTGRSPAPLLGPLGWKGAALFLVGCLGLGLAVVRAGGIVALVAPSVLGGLCLLVLVRFLTASDGDADARRLMRWTFAAFALHLVVSLIITNTESLLRFLGGDATTYHFYAQQIVRHWDSGFPMPGLPKAKEGFYYLLAGVYWVFGANTAAGLAVNATMAAALVPIVTDTTRRLFGVRVARYAAPLTLLVPGVLLWTSQLLKEAAILFLLVAAANCAVRISERITPAPVAILAATLAVLFTFRGWVGVLAAGGLIVGIAFSRRQLLSGLGTGAAALALISTLVLVTGLGYSGYQTTVSSDLERASSVRRDLATSASSGYSADADISTPTRALTYLPLAMTTFLLGPLPWQISGVRQLPAVPDMLVWWALLPSLWRGMTAGGRQRGRQILVLLMPALTTSILLALVIANFGTQMRERTQVYILLVPFICLGLSLRHASDDSDDEGSQRLPNMSDARMTRWR